MRRAFSMIELLVTIVIVAVLVVLVTLAVGNYVERARLMRLRHTVAVLNEAVDEYRTLGGMANAHSLRGAAGTTQNARTLTEAVISAMKVGFTNYGRHTSFVNQTQAIDTTVIGSTGQGKGFYFTLDLGTSETTTTTPGTSAPVITKQPSSVSGYFEQAETFSLTATGGGLSYQWQYSSDGENFENIGGASESVYAIVSLNAITLGSYRCTVSNSLGSVTSNIVSASLINHPFTYEGEGLGGMGSFDRYDQRTDYTRDAGFYIGIPDDCNTYMDGVFAWAKDCSFGVGLDEDHRSATNAASFYVGAFGASNCNVLLEDVTCYLCQIWLSPGTDCATGSVQGSNNSMTIKNSTVYYLGTGEVVIGGWFSDNTYNNTLTLSEGTHVYVGNNFAIPGYPTGGYSGDGGAKDGVFDITDKGTIVENYSTSGCTVINFNYSNANSTGNKVILENQALLKCGGYCRGDGTCTQTQQLSAYPGSMEDPADVCAFCFGGGYLALYGNYVGAYDDTDSSNYYKWNFDDASHAVVPLSILQVRDGGAWRAATADDFTATYCTTDDEGLAATGGIYDGLAGYTVITAGASSSSTGTSKTNIRAALTVAAEDIVYGDDSTVTVNISGVDAGVLDGQTVTLTVNGAAHVATVKDNQVVFTISDLSIGSYTAKAVMAQYEPTGGTVVYLSASAKDTLTVRSMISSQPVGYSGAPGASVTLSVTASGVGTLTYQWYKDSVAISGATALSYTLLSVAESDNGKYEVVVSSSKVSQTSSTARIYVYTGTLSLPALENLVINLDSATNLTTSGTAVTQWQTVDGDATFTVDTGDPVVDASDALNSHYPVRFTSDRMSTTAATAMPTAAAPRAMAVLVRNNNAASESYNGLISYGTIPNLYQIEKYSSYWAFSTWSDYASSLSATGNDLRLLILSYDGTTNTMYSANSPIQTTTLTLSTPESTFKLGGDSGSDLMNDCSIWGAWGWSRALTTDEISQLVDYVNASYSTGF